MNGRFEAYLQEQLGTTGFAILDHEAANQLRPDIFGTPANCHHAFSESLPRLDEYLRNIGAGLYAARLELAEQRFYVAARSADQLEQRIQWLTGRKGAEIMPAQSVLMAAAAVSRQPVQIEGIPAWPCNARTEALAAAGQREETFRESQAGTRRDRSL